MFKKKFQDKQSSKVSTVKKYHKGEVLSWWEITIEDYIANIETNTVIPMAELMEVLPSNFTGSRFGHDSLRIEGSKVYIGRILALVAPLLELENNRVRLELSMYELNNGEIVKPLNDNKKHYVLYVRAIDRKPEHII